MGSSMGQGVGKAVPKSYFSRYQWTSQFQGAELIAQKWGITRDDLDEFGKRSQDLAAQAWAEGRYDTPDRRRSTRPTSARTASRPAPPTPSPSDEGLRETTLEGLGRA